MGEFIVKHSVRMDTLQPHMIVALMVVLGVFSEIEKACVLTSVNDSKHSPKSLHRYGLAFDVAPIDGHMDKPQLRRVATTIRQRLAGNEYDVVFEDDHIHVEYDPVKRG